MRQPFGTRLLAGVCAAGLSLSGPAVAQSIEGALQGGDSGNRNISIATGFTPDPVTRSYVSGGPRAVQDVYGSSGLLGGSCRGHIAEEPDHILTLESDFGYLKLWVESSNDTTMVIDGPNDFVLCNDDGGNNLNAAISADDWPSGEYQVYVGSYSSGSYHDYTLNVTELSSRGP